MHLFYFIYFIFLIYLIDYAITVVPFPPFIPLHPAHPLPPTFPRFSSCPWVVHTSSLASLFPILFLTSPVYFLPTIYASLGSQASAQSTEPCQPGPHLCFLVPVPFTPFSPLPLPSDNPPCDLHFCDSVPVLVVCLVFGFVF